MQAGTPCASTSPKQWWLTRQVGFLLKRMQSHHLGPDNRREDQISQPFDHDSGHVLPRPRRSVRRKLDHSLVCSVDGGLQPTLFVTEWQSQRKILNFPLPHKQRAAPVESVSMRYSYQANILGIVENEAGGGYRLMFWEIKNNIMNLIFLNEIEQSSSCCNLLFFETIRGGLQLATVERTCIKYWQFEAKKATLVHRIHLRSPVVSASVSRLTNLLCVVDQLGRSAFLDSQVA